MKDEQYLPGPLATNWIESLALDEINMEESGVIDFNHHLNIEYILEESSIDFMSNLREIFEIFVSKFNEYRTSNNSNYAIKMFKISNTVNDFMLFRNSLKLVAARKASDVISIGLLSNSGGIYSARMDTHDSPNNSAHEIRAHIGPFNEVSWRFNGEPVKLEALVKHYLTEFIRLSAR